MSFNTALTGLNAATADLNVKSNNIANVNTIGFKGSRAEFGDVYSLSAFGSSRTAIGSGTVLNNVAQQFGQGNVEFTDNSLDLAITGSGQGFFALAPALDSNELIYSRAGAFQINAEGYVQNSSGQFLRAFPVNPDGSVSATAVESTTALRLPSTAGVPQATSEVDIATNLPSTAVGFTATPIDPTDPNSYTNSTSTVIFDSLGNQSVLTYYYQKTDTPNTWNVDVYIDEPDGLGANQTQLGATTTLEFDPVLGGALSTAPASFTYTIGALQSGAATPQEVEIDFAGTTQNSGAFTVLDSGQDGFTTGRLSGLDIGENGLVRASYTNGQFANLGKIVLADFPNPQGLKQIGNTAWEETIDSGEVRVGEAGAGAFGLIQSGALEGSNIDLTRELIGLITAQRNFQANSKSIETNNAITQTIINLR